ncbi:MAG TPA: multiheme c-type cytochrome [Chthonomonadales bacterium]|nr:multiheme c-type cytochrome [Chthonomonadales bacterium]
MNHTTRSSLGLLCTMLSGLMAFLVITVWWTRSIGASHGTITLFVTGDTRGYLEPCGCRRDQAGGLPARMTLIRQDTSSEHLLVDVGNLTSGGRAYELLKLNYLLKGLNQIGYHALNLGRREAGLDRDALAAIIRESQAPFVSCNVMDRAKSTPLAEPYRLFTVGGVRIGITGVTEAPEDEVGPGVMVRPAAEALAQTLPKMKQLCDYVIVLAFASSETLKTLAARFHEIDCLLGGDVPQSSERAERLNRAVAFNVTDKGKVLGKLTFRRNDHSLELTDSAALKVKDSISPAPEMTALLAAYRNELRERNLEFATGEELEPIASVRATADTYVGQDACAPCHPKAHQISLAAAHSHAYQTLVQKKAEYDPECLRCHTVGYGARDGFISMERTPQFAGVQCETCHGRAGEHVKSMKNGLQRASTFRPVTPNSCIRCHDEENDGRFDFTHDWAMIKHGAE